MTKTLTSPDSGKKYFLSIENGRATQCNCPDRLHRSWKPCCKHMVSFNAEVEKAAAFQALMARFDVRSQAVREQEYTNYLNWQLSMGL